MNFIKQHWFVLGLVVLLAIAAIRRNWTQYFIQRTNSTKIEKYTEKNAAVQGESAQSGFFVSNSGSVIFPEIDPKAGQAFVLRFSQVVQAEQRKFGVPAAALLACAYVNSFAGQRPLAAEAHNYFALPCTPNWTGATTVWRDRCYRKPATAWESFRDFSLYLSSQDWYANTKQQAGQNPQAWLSAIAEHGLSDVENFEQHAQAVMESYRLDALN